MTLSLFSAFSEFPAVLGAATGIGATYAMRWTQEHRAAATAVSDLINWGFMVDPGVILQKDGAFVAGWSYHGPDVLAATAAELDHLSQQVNDALLPFGNHWMFHIDAVRHPAAAYPASAFPNAVTALIDAERRLAYSTSGPQFETRYVLTVTYLPAPELYDRAAAVFVTGDSTHGLQWDQRLDAFRFALGAVELRLGHRLQMQRLSSEALLQHLHRCLTGLDHPVMYPPDGTYLDALLADQPLVGGFEPRIGEQHLRMIAVTGYPAVSVPGLLDTLNHLPFAFRWSNRVIPLSQQTAATLIRRHQLNWFKKRKGAGTWLREMAAKDKAAIRAPDEALFRDQHAQSMAEDASHALAHNNAGAVRYCVYNQILVVSDRDPLQATTNATEILKTLHDHGCTARIETVNALDAFLGTLPGHGAPNVRRPLLHTRNIADTVPITGVWPGHATNPSPYFPPQSPPLLWAKTNGSTPFRVNLHSSDVGHTLIVGKTGAGKSTLVGLIVAQFQRYAHAQVFVFDVGYSGWLLAHAAGAQHYDIGRESLAPHAPERDDAHSLAFQPLARVDQQADRMWAADWIAMMVELQGVTITPRHRVRIHRALTLLGSIDRAHRTISELTVHLQDPELALALRPYTTYGDYGRLLDANADALGLQTDDTAGSTAYQVFELKHLIEMDDKILVPTLLYLFHRVEQRLDGRPTLIVIEELWAPLMRTVFAKRIKQWLVTLRKQNAAVLLVAHSPAQFDAIPESAMLIDSCPTRIFLPNPDARSPQNASRYRAFGLNDHEIDRIACARPKHDYYMTTPQGSRVFELGLGPASLAFLATPSGQTIDDTRAAVQTLITQHQDRWPIAWLQTLGLREWSDQYVREANAIAHRMQNNSSPPSDPRSEIPHAIHQ